MPKKKDARLANGMNTNNIIVFDFETLGPNPQRCEPIQVAALAIDGRKLTPIEGGTFSSMMRPAGPVESWDVDLKALEINKKTIAEIDAAPAMEAVWRQFVDFTARYHKGGFKGAPIPAGQFIKGFDLHIATRLCERYNIAYNKEEKRQTMFNHRNQIDLVDISFLWFENAAEPTDHSLKTMCEFLGVPTEGSHDAYVDVTRTWSIIEKFMRLHRKMSPYIKFKDCFLTAN